MPSLHRSMTTTDRKKTTLHITAYIFLSIKEFEGTDLAEAFKEAEKRRASTK